MKKFQKDTTNKFINQGVNLALSADRLPAGQYQILRNVRTYLEGEVRTRPGTTQVNSVAINSIHSGTQLNDSTGLFARTFGIVLGGATQLYLDNAAHNAFSSIDSGYSGSPLTFSPFRPNQSPSPWLYIGDQNKNTKARIDGTVFRQGIVPPNAPPTGSGGNPVPTINTFQFTTVDSGIGDAVFWTPDNTVVNFRTDGTGPTDTAAAFIPDTGAVPGFANFAVTSPAGPFYQPGTIIRVLGPGPVEDVIVDSVYPAMNKPTTISAITYDAGLTGAATITLNNARKNVTANSVIQFTGTGEYARILSVSVGKDGYPAIRVNVANTYTAGSPITGVFSWRAYFTGSHPVGTQWQFRFIAGVANGVAANTTAIGSMSRTLALDLSSIGGRPLQDTDTLNIGVLIDQYVSEIQVQIQLGGPTQYYLVVLRPSDFTPLTTGDTTSTLSLQQRKIQRDSISATPISPDLTQSLSFQRLTTKVAKLTAAGQTKHARKVQARLDRLQSSVEAGGLVDGSGAIGGSGGDPSGGGSGTGGGSGGTGGGGHHHKGRSGGGTGGSGGGTGGGTGGGGTGTGTGAPTSGTIAIGVGQWTAAQVQIKDIARVGSDSSLTWANVTGAKIQVTFVNSTAAPINSTFDFGSIWIGGTFGPTASGQTDSGVSLTPYLYRCAFRSTITGARSNPGPATRNGVTPNNSQVQLVGPTSSDGQVDKVDYFRFGGTINAWRYIGSSSPGAQFNDSLPDLEILSMPLMLSDLVTPWPIIDTPKSGTCNVAGTMVTATSGTFNTLWDQGTEILINGIPQEIYRVLSTSLLEIVTNAGNLVGTSYELPDPVIIGQPLPVIWGPFGTGKFGTVMFGVGSPTQPEALFWTNADDPDSAADTNFNEVTSPSEPLMNGFIYNGRAGVFSSERLFSISEAIDPISNSQYFTVDEIPTGKGLWSRWAMATTPYGIVFLSKDGIYLTTGGAPVQLSANLYPIFPHDGIAGSSTTTFVGTSPDGAYQYLAVDMTQTTSLRLVWIDQRLEFWYKDLGGTTRTWICKGLDAQSPVWESNDDYSPSMNVSFPGTGAAVHTRYLCGSDGRLYQSSGASLTDNGTSIKCEVATRADDLGDSRIEKRFGDLTLDADSDGAAITIRVLVDIFATLVLSTTKSPVVRTPQQIIDITQAVNPPGTNNTGVISRNIGLDLSWASLTTLVTLYEWMPSFTPKDDVVILRATERDDLGMPGAKFVQGLLMRADTLGATKTIQIQADNGPNGQMTTQLTLANVVHNGESIIAYPNDQLGWDPFICHLVKMQPTDANPWLLYDYQWIWEPAPELATEWFTQETTFDLQGFVFIRDYNIPHFSTADINLTVTHDDASTVRYTIPNSGGGYDKTYFTGVAKKFKAVKFDFTSTAPFRLVKKDCEVRVQQWGGRGPLMRVMPFGGPTRESGALV